MSLADAGYEANDFVNTVVNNGVPRTLFQGNYGGYCSDWETRRGVANGGLDPESPYVECQADAFTCEASKSDLGIADGANCATATLPDGAAESEWQDKDATTCEIQFATYLPDNCVGELISTFCDDTLNWCVLQWCYVSADCPSAQPSNYFGASAFTSGTVETQLYYSYLACGTPDCYTHTLDSIPDNAPFGCPYDPLGNYGCEATEIVIEDQHPIDSGCPAGSGNSALTMNFEQARVIHRNLNGQFCNEDEWGTDGGSLDTSVPAGSIDTVEITPGGKRLPIDCFYQNSGTPDVNRPIPNEILFCFESNEFQNQNENGDELCLQITETTDNYRCEDTEKCGDVLDSKSTVLCQSDCRSKLGQIQLDQRSQPADKKTLDLKFTVVACPNPLDEPCTEELWDEMIMTFLDIDGNSYRTEELVFKDVWDYHLTSIDSIVGNNEGEYPACPQMLESCTGNGEATVEVIPSGAKKVMNTDGSCKYVSPLAQITGIDNDGNPLDESTKTLQDQWAYSIDGTYLYSNEDDREFSRGVENADVCLDSITAWHAIYPDEDTIGDTVGELEIVDNSKFRTQRGVMFPHMNIQISDPNRVYRWLNTRLGDNVEDYFWVDDRSTGDLIIRNRDDLGNNGAIGNPTSLDTLNWAQASRAIAPQWVSGKFLAQRYFNIDAGTGVGVQRSSFEVRMGTQKRTILFSGQANALSSQCVTCQSGFFDAGNSCPANYQPINLNRICEIEGHAVVPDLADSCNANYCCEPLPTSHGDPIIWTFNNECYDLDKDGLYSATKHADYNHEVKIAVYNNYMREIQVVDTRSGDILLSIDTTGNVISDKFRYHFTEHTFNCPSDMKETECVDEFKLWEFDAQNFRYAVHLLRHDYDDAGLAEGELGYHLDVYPKPFKNFEKKRAGYTGLYFENPLPEELEYCVGGSKHSRYMD